jgi:hypothetical protein
MNAALIFIIWYVFYDSLLLILQRLDEAILENHLPLQWLI